MRCSLRSPGRHLGRASLAALESALTTEHDGGRVPPGIRIESRLVAYGFADDLDRRLVHVTRSTRALRASKLRHDTPRR